MNSSATPRAVIDADIIYSRVLHELLGRIAIELKLIDIFWSEALLAEAQKVLVEKKGLSHEIAQRWVEHLRRNFPVGRIDVRASQAVDLVDLTTDPADQHVCALAVAANADYLFTHDRGYLRDGLQRYGIAVRRPDEFLADAFDADVRGMLDVVEHQAGVWAGGRSVEELADALERAGARALADRVRRSLA